MSCFYSNSEWEWRTETSKKGIQRSDIQKANYEKTDNYIIGCCTSFLFDKTEEMSPFVSFTGTSFFPFLFIFFGWQFNDSIYIVKKCLPECQQ